MCTSMCDGSSEESRYVIHGPATILGTVRGIAGQHFAALVM